MKSAAACRSSAGITRAGEALEFQHIDGYGVGLQADSVAFRSQNGAVLPQCFANIGESITQAATSLLLFTLAPE